MNRYAILGMSAIAMVAGMAHAQTNPDYRVRAQLRTPDNGAWGANESVGNAEFRVQSRFLQVYYGGVARQDEFKFNVQIDFTLISGFAMQFASSPYNTDYDVYIGDMFVGRVPMSPFVNGIADLTYDSRHASPPDSFPVPTPWPSPILPGTTVRIFFAQPVLPGYGDPFPTTITPVFMSNLEERFARGDANHDGHVNSQDFAILAAHYDPPNIVGPHIGPAAGDFTGDNTSDLGDYNIMVQNWDSSQTPPAAPVSCFNTLNQPASTTTCRTESASFNATATGQGSFSYQWRRNGINISNATNSTARSATLVINNVSAANIGNYSCVVTNGCGSVTTQTATLSVPALCCDSIDFNRDSSAFDPQDIDAFLSVYGEGPCIPATASCDDIDFNNDTSVFDPCDIDSFLTMYSEGPCTACGQ